MSQDSTTSLSLRLPIARREMGVQESASVLARDLHAALEISKKYADWFRDQCRRANLAETFDWCVLPRLGKNPGRPRVDHALTANAAKSIAMMSETAKGTEVREYFIDRERISYAPAPMSREEMRLLVFRQLEEEVAEERAGRLLAEATIEDQRPAVEFALDVMQGETEFSTREAMKAVGSAVKLGPGLWRDLEKRGAFFVAAANGTARHWRPCHVRAGFGYDCLKRIRSGRQLAMVPLWKPRGLPHLREFLITRERQLNLRRAR